jgi:hypothetical protein
MTDSERVVELIISTKVWKDRVQGAEEVIAESVWSEESANSHSYKR